jgi:hypothetical protein
MLETVAYPGIFFGGGGGGGQQNKLRTEGRENGDLGAVKLQPCYSQLTYARNIPNAVCVAPPEDEQVMLETCRGSLILNKLNEKCITLVSLYWLQEAFASLYPCQVSRSEVDGGSRCLSSVSEYVHITVHMQLEARASQPVFCSYTLH